MMEAVVASVKDQWGWTRKTAVTIVTVVTILLGIFISMGYGGLSHWTVGDMHLLDFFDFISNSVLMPVMALLTCLFVGYVISPKLLAEEIGLSGRFKRQKMFAFIIRYVAPAFIFIILLSSVLDMLGVWKL
jgi:NSS family neurotransmitter:Na+ symporter